MKFLNSPRRIKFPIGKFNNIIHKEGHAFELLSGPSESIFFPVSDHHVLSNLALVE